MLKEIKNFDGIQNKISDNQDLKNISKWKQIFQTE